MSKEKKTNVMRILDKAKYHTSQDLMNTKKVICQAPTLLPPSDMTPP